MLPIILLCFATIPLDQGDSATVVFVLMFNCSTISFKTLVNTPLLSDRNKFGVPKRAIQCLNILSMITSCD